MRMPVWNGAAGKQTKTCNDLAPINWRKSADRLPACRLPESTTQRNIENMSTIALGLAILLQTVRHPSDFHPMGRSEVNITHLKVTGAGSASLPL